MTTLRPAPHRIVRFYCFGTCVGALGRNFFAFVEAITLMGNKLGFGFMRLPKVGDKLDYEQTCRMVDEYMANGFNYFDTAHGYHNGESEIAIRECVTSRYPRESYILTNKLTNFYFASEEEIRPFFEKQLIDCGVDYFDYYLMHAQGADSYKYFKERRAYETSLELKAEGKIKHFGISFHDTAEVLEQILTEYPQIEVVQIQFNYLDYEDEAVEARKVYEVCLRHGKPVIVMEPVKGGKLANLPNEAKAIFDRLGSGNSYASYAMRFAAGFDDVMMVLSGMSDQAQMEDNIKTLKNFVPLSDAEQAAVKEVCETIRGLGDIQCTACRYCIAGCPMKISIPDLFSCMNTKQVFNDWNQDWYYNEVYTKNNGKASECIGCGNCELACPQHLRIRDLLKDVAQTFEHK